MSKSINPMLFLKPGKRLFRASPRLHRFDEFATGYSSAGFSPALPASASPDGAYLQATGSYLSTLSFEKMSKLDLKARARQNIKHQGWTKLDDRSGPCRMIKLMLTPSWTRGRWKGFLTQTRIEVDDAMNRAIWREAGDRFRRYADRRKKAGANPHRRLVADFVIDAHGLLNADRLITFNGADFRLDFPELRIAPDPAH